MKKGKNIGSWILVYGLFLTGSSALANELSVTPGIRFHGDDRSSETKDTVYSFESRFRSTHSARFAHVRISAYGIATGEEPQNARFFLQETSAEFGLKHIFVGGGWRVFSWSDQEIFQIYDFLNAKSYLTFEPELIGEPAVGLEGRFHSVRIEGHLLLDSQSHVFPERNSRLNPFAGLSVRSRLLYVDDDGLKATGGQPSGYVTRATLRLDHVDARLLAGESFDKSRPTVRLAADNSTDADLAVQSMLFIGGGSGFVLGSSVLQFDLLKKEYKVPTQPGITGLKDTAWAASGSLEHSVGLMDGSEILLGIEGIYEEEEESNGGVDEYSSYGGYARYALNDMHLQEFSLLAFRDQRSAEAPSFALSYSQQIDGNLKGSITVRSLAPDTSGRSAFSGRVEKTSIDLNLHHHLQEK